MAKPKILSACLLVLLTSLIPGCGSPTDSQLPLAVVGDVATPLDISSLAETPTTQKIEHREERLEVAPLEPMIQEAEPHAEQYEILFIAQDGFSAQISNADLSESYLALNQENGWEAINLNHPVSSNIKNIQEIVIICQDMQPENYFNIIQPGKDITRLSVGEMYKNGYSLFSTVRGSSEVDNEGQILTATTYYQHRGIDMNKYANLEGRDAVVVGQDGQVVPLRQDGRFVLDQNSIGYMAEDELQISQVAGIVLDPPDKSITDVYHDAKAALEDDIPMLVILVDGLGSHQYQYASSQGYTPFLDTLPQPQNSMSAYPSITPVNLAASLSGELPNITGVHDRRTRQLEVPTIFALSEEMGKTMTAVFGPLGTIELEVQPIFSVDRNQDDSTDDEKTDNTLDIIDAGHDLLFVHYKDVDSTGHDYGDLHEKTLEAIRGNDEYIRQLVSRWQGRVLIFADHGMYETETGGTHGALVHKSMFTPYWLFETGE